MGKNLIRIGGIFVSILICLSLLSGCSGKKSLVGSWRREYHSDTETFTFDEKGTGEYDGYYDYSIRSWKTSGDQLNIEYSGKKEQYTYQIDGKKLILIDGNNKKKTYRKLK